MQKFSQLRPVARGYVAVVVGVGLAAVVHSVAVLFRDPIPQEWFALAALTLLTGSFTIKSSIHLVQDFCFGYVRFRIGFAVRSGSRNPDGAARNSRDFAMGETRVVHDLSGNPL